jgi:beta-glucosidase
MIMSPTHKSTFTPEKEPLMTMMMNSHNKTICSNSNSSRLNDTDDTDLENPHRSPNEKQEDEEECQRILASSPPLLTISPSDLTLLEKLDLLSGTSLWTTAGLEDRWSHMRPLTLADGPHGVRKPVSEISLIDSYPATCFPNACALACSWNEAVLQSIGHALADECYRYQVHILLGPGLNLKRHACGGRNFEYYSEDPVLSGRLAASYVQGVQQDDNHRVAACLKHFVANNQESHRFVVNVVVDERTLRELYYRQFEIAIQQQSSSPQPAATLMVAYNRLNGMYCSEHFDLLQNIVRKEWKYEGVILTDWGATNDRVAGIRAGVDLEMPGSHGAHHWEIAQALRDGSLSMEQVDQSIQRLLHLLHKYGSSTNGYTDDEDIHIEDAHLREMWDRHYQLAYEAAVESMVLLKNDHLFLPWKHNHNTSSGRIAVIGEFAKQPRYQGMGSSRVTSPKVTDVWTEIQKRIPSSNLSFAPGYHVDDENVEAHVDSYLLQEAIAVAQSADKVLLCVGLPEIMESEGFDRTHCYLPAQHVALLQEIVNVNPNVVVVLSNGGVVELPTELIHQVPAILEGYLLGEAGGAATVDLLFGVHCPSGKLAETFAIHQSDALADRYFPGNRHRVEYREGLLVGYRYFDTVQYPVQFPFGHGLSYTEFQYRDLQVQVIQDEDTTKLVEVAFVVQNIGPIAGKEIVQCYIHDVESTVFRPEQELKEFCKVALEPGESKIVQFRLSETAFSFYDIGHKDWICERGDFVIRIGASSRDIRLHQKITLQNGPAQASIEAQNAYPPILNNSKSMIDEVDDETFAKRFGSEYNRLIASDHGDGDDYEVENHTKLQPFHRNSLLKELASKRWLGRLLLFTVYKSASKEVRPGPTYNRQVKLVKEVVKNLPLRALVLFSRGGFSFDTLDACIALANYHFLTAFKGFALAVYHFVFRKRRHSKHYV